MYFDRGVKLSNACARLAEGMIHSGYRENIKAPSRIEFLFTGAGFRARSSFDMYNDQRMYLIDTGLLEECFAADDFDSIKSAALSAAYFVLRPVN